MSKQNYNKSSVYDSFNIDELLTKVEKKKEKQDRKKQNKKNGIYIY